MWPGCHHYPLLLPGKPSIGKAGINLLFFLALLAVLATLSVTSQRSRLN